MPRRAGVSDGAETHLAGGVASRGKLPSQVMPTVCGCSSLTFASESRAAPVHILYVVLCEWCYIQMPGFRVGSHGVGRCVCLSAPFSCG